MQNLFTILIVIFISACNCKEKCQEIPKISLQKESYSYNVDFKIIKSVLYKDFLILFGEKDSLHLKFRVINLQINKEDNSLQNNLQNENISNILVRNDSLYSFYKKTKNWKVWKDKWVDCEMEFERYFTKRELDWEFGYAFCPLYEDSTYFIHAYSFGEFGSVIYFFNKKDKKTFFDDITEPVAIKKDSNGYLIVGSLPHEIGHSSIKRILNPNNLLELPEEQNALFSDSIRIDKQKEFMQNKIINLLPDTFKKEKGKEYLYYQHIYSAWRQYQSKMKISEIVFDKLSFLTHLPIKVESRYYFIMNYTKNDFLAYLANDTVYSVDTLFVENNHNDFHTQTNNQYSFIAYNLKDWHKQNNQMICLIFENKKVKRYQFK